MFTLVNPPFVSLWRPNLGLSMLKAQLTQAGHPSVIYYADHDLAVRLGLEQYAWVHEDHGAMIGEWLFSGFVRSSGSWDFDFLDFLQKSGYSAQQAQTLRHWTGELEDYLRAVTSSILDTQPRVVGCSSTFQQNNAALAILKKIKEADPKVVTMMGGANLEAELAEPFIHYPWIDYTVSGEAEGCINRLYELCCEYGNGIPAPFLPGPVSSSTLVGQSERGKVDHLDDLPRPDFDDYFTSLAAFPQLHGVSPVLVLEGSRGCWWGQVKHCTFCGLNGSGMAYRAKSPQRMLEEIQFMSLRYSIKRIQMVDNIIAPRHLKELLPQLAKNRQHGLQFFWEVKANLKAAHFELLRQAGVLWIQPGIESFSDHTLSLMRKGQRAIQNLLVLKAARENGIKLFWNILLGHPGETAADLRHQKKLITSILHLQPPSDVCQVRADRFSPLFAENPDLKPYAVYAYIYDLGVDDLRKIAYYFQVDSVSQPSPEFESMVLALHKNVDYWKTCWNRSDSVGLHFSPEEPLSVVDQRRLGGAQIHLLDQEEWDILHECCQPTKIADLEKSVGIGAESLARKLANLADLGLCYCDDSHVLSLVLRAESSGLPPIPADPLTRSGCLLFGD